MCNTIRHWMNRVNCSRRLIHHLADIALRECPLVLNMRKKCSRREHIKYAQEVFQKRSRSILMTSKAWQPTLMIFSFGDLMNTSTISDSKQPCGNVKS